MVHPVTAGAASIVSYLALRAVRPYVPALIGDDRVQMVASLALGAGMLIHFKEPLPEKQIEVREVKVVDEEGVKELEGKIERRESDTIALEEQLEGTRQFARQVIQLLPNTRAQEELLLELEDRREEVVRLNVHSLADELAGVASPARDTPVKQRRVPMVRMDFELDFPMAAPRFDREPQTSSPEIKYIDREVVREVIKWKVDPKLAKRTAELEKQVHRLDLALEARNKSLAAQEKELQSWAEDDEESRQRIKQLKLEVATLEKEVAKVTLDRNWYQGEYGKAVELLTQRK